MSHDITVDIAELRSTAEKTAGMVDRATSLKQAAQVAAVPEISWGLIGVMSVYWIYRDMLGDLTEHLDRMAAGFGGMSEKLAGAADTYQRIEDDGVAAFDTIRTDVPVEG